MAQPGRIGRFEIHTVLGQGGMGTVYRAYDPLMDRWVAIKAVTVQDTQQRARFQQEVRAAGRLNHPQIITIYDVGEQDELAYIVMELVEGDTLTGHLSTPVSWSEAFRLLLPICHALAYAHNQGVIHRDVKPANILISQANQVKLTDFGVARLEAALRRITESGSTVGTPLYTAPEQLRNDDIDGRADLFSVGIVLFELITGQHPFMADTLAQVIYRITQPEPVSLEALAALAPASVVELVGRALNKEAEARFASAEDMAAALDRCLTEPDVTLPPPAPAARSKSQSIYQLLIDIVPSNLHLSPAEEALLRTAFSGHDRIYLEREFSSGYSGARVLLVTPVRSGGRRLAQVILKIDTGAAINEEWRAYQKYVKDTLPPVTARILEAPTYAADRQLALLRYTFAGGGVGSAAPESLQSYYAHHSGPEVATLLEKSVFRAFGTNWWLQRQTDNLILRREYDRLLPVHVVVAWQDATETIPSFRTLVAGETGADVCRELEIGQIVQLQGFTVEEIEPTANKITLQALPPSGTSTNPIRIRVTGLSDQLSSQVGDIIPNLWGTVTATRRDLLHQLAQSAWPAQNFEERQLTIGGQLYPNPLSDYEAVLDQRISTMRSIIHGDLNLQNILVTPTSGLAWLIDFATTRQGHNLYDFMRLETQVITKLLPQTRASPEDVAHLMLALHSPDASDRPLPTELQKPLAVLTGIRRMVRVCMHNRENWDEHYLGLVLMLLGALKFKELDANARRVTLAAAATVRGLITVPSLLHTPTPAPTPAATPVLVQPKMIGIAVAGLVLLAILGGLGFWIMGPSLAPETATPIPSTSVAVATSSSTPTVTPPPTATPSSIAEVETATPTPVPTTPPPTVTPSPTATLSPTINCLPPTFYDSLSNDYPGLGCSVEAWESDFTYQQFERGAMVWRKSPEPSQIYVLAGSGVWRSYEDPNGPPVPSCPEAQQNNDLGPIFGFGVVWCNQEMEQLGRPLTKEMSFEDSPVERFTTGLAYQLDQTSYLLSDNNKWESFFVFQPTPNPNTILEDFESFNTASLRQTFNLNYAGDANEVAIDVITLAGRVNQGQVLALNYEIKADAPNDYVGLDRDLSADQRWVDFQAVRLWVWNMGLAKTIVFQWGESQQRPGGGEVWRATVSIQPEEVRVVEIPLTTQNFKRADWPGGGDNQMELDQVSYYGFYLESTAGDRGTVFVDSLELVPGVDRDTPTPQATPTPEPTFTPTTCSPTPFQPADVFKPLWDALGAETGSLCYPVAGASTAGNYARQPFERGFMFWWEAPTKPQPVWVIQWTDPLAPSGDTWAEYQDEWDGQWEYPPGCPEAGPPLGPKRGFGFIWCDKSGVKDKIGLPLDPEFGSDNQFPKGAVQFFQGGIMFENPAEQEVWALIYDNGWYRQGY